MNIDYDNNFDVFLDRCPKTIPVIYRIKLNLIRAKYSNLGTEKTPDPKDLINSFFNKYKLSIISIAAVLFIAILLIGYFVFINKPDKQTQIPIQLPNAILVLDEPQDQQATTSSEIVISGKTNPNSQVVAYTDTSEEIFESDENGKFSGVFVLEEGPNEITITAFGNKEEEVTETRSVVYITEGEL